MMKKEFKLIVALAFAVVSLWALAAVSNASPAFLDLQNVKKNEVGEGYHWVNKEDVLYIENLNINTDCDYGLKLPPKCTVELNGNNTIKASKYGIGCYNDVVFKGTGTLTVEAGDTAIYFYSENENNKILFLDGTVKLVADKYGIYSKSAQVSVTGGAVSIESGDMGISAHTVSLVGGTFSSKGGVSASDALTVSGINLDIASNGGAALKGTKISVDQVKIYSEKNGEELEEYTDGEKVYMTADINARSSVIFSKLLGRDGVNAAWDYVLIIAAVIAIFLIVGLPIIIKKKKTAKMLKKLEE